MHQKGSTQISFDWKIRRVIHDIAKGLAYLHEECRQKIVHLDVKPQNILLDDDFCAKVSDFGLAKLVDENQSQIVTRIRGTPWLLNGLARPLQKKQMATALELLQWRSSVDARTWTIHTQLECPYLFSLFMEKAKNNQLIDMIGNYRDDPQCNTSEVIRTMQLAVWCLQTEFTLRPSMSMVV